MYRPLLLAVLAGTAACVGLKEDERVTDADGGTGAAGQATPEDGAGEGGRRDGQVGADGGANGGSTIARVPDHRVDGELTTTSDGVVVDSLTGLRWKLARSPQALDFAAATQLCADTRTEGTSDWRLPTKLELLSIADFTSTRTGSTWPTPFADDNGFWSADVSAGVAPVRPIWCVFFADPGASTRSPTPTEAIETRCVRGAKLGRAVLVREGNLVRDTASGRTWEGARAPDMMKVADAAARCAALSIDGTSGFRLPQAKELLSLLDDKLPAAPFEDAILPAPRGGLLMTSTPRRNVRDAVNAVDFDTGRVDAAASGYVRCVR
jgi:hypothetical protein